MADTFLAEQRLLTGLEVIKHGRRRADICVLSLAGGCKDESKQLVIERGSLGCSSTSGNGKASTVRLRRSRARSDESSQYRFSRRSGTPGPPVKTKENIDPSTDAEVEESAAKERKEMLWLKDIVQVELGVELSEASRLAMGTSYRPDLSIRIRLESGEVDLTLPSVRVVEEVLAFLSKNCPQMVVGQSQETLHLTHHRHSSSSSEEYLPSSLYMFLPGSENDSSHGSRTNRSVQPPLLPPTLPVTPTTPPTSIAPVKPPLGPREEKRRR
ncbi:unnamed protein product, partial [Choristocarpus tenellus]